MRSIHWSFLFLLLGVAFPCLSEADIVEKKFTRSSDGKTATGQVFVPSKQFSTQRKRSRSSGRLPTVSHVVLPSLTEPAKTAPQKQLQAKAPNPQVPKPRFGHGSDGGNPAVPVPQEDEDVGYLSDIGDDVVLDESALSPPATYIFSPRYNSNEYIPVYPYHFAPIPFLPDPFFHYRPSHIWSSPFISVRITR